MNFFETVADPDAAPVGGEPFGEVAQSKTDPAAAAGFRCWWRFFCVEMLVLCELGAGEGLVLEKA